MPLGWVLSLFYTLTDSYIISLVVLTILVRLALLPASVKQQKNTAKQTRLNAKVNKIKTKYAGNQQKIQEETQALYQREGFGAANMGCMPLLIQMFVMLGLYAIIRTPITSVLNFDADMVANLAKELGLEIAEKGRNASTYQLDILKLFEENKETIANILADSPGKFEELEKFLSPYEVRG